MEGKDSSKIGIYFLASGIFFAMGVQLLSKKIEQSFYRGFDTASIFLLFLPLLYLIISFPIAILSYKRGGMKTALWLTVPPTIFIVLHLLGGSYGLMWLLSFGILSPLGLLN